MTATFDLTRVKGRDPRAVIRTAIPEKESAMTATEPTSPVASYLTKGAYAMGKGDDREAAYNLALAAISAITGVGDEVRKLRETIERLAEEEEDE